MPANRLDGVVCGREGRHAGIRPSVRVDRGAAADRDGHCRGELWDVNDHQCSGGIGKS
jgi:hypothetical protein